MSVGGEILLDELLLVHLVNGSLSVTEQKVGHDEGVNEVDGEGEDDCS